MRKRRRNEDVAAATNTLLHVLPFPPFPLGPKTKQTLPALALPQQSPSAFLFLKEDGGSRICRFFYDSQRPKVFFPPSWSTKTDTTTPLDSLLDYQRKHVASFSFISEHRK